MRGIATGLMLMVCASAHAAIITFDPNDYAVGTNISHAQPGVSVAHSRWTAHTTNNPIPPTRTFDVVATRCTDRYYSCLSEDGLGFGMSSGLQDYFPCFFPNQHCSSGSYLEFTFDDPTDYVAVLTNWAYDPPGLFAYDAADTLLYYCWAGECGSPYLPNPYQQGRQSTVSLYRAERDISRIVVGSFAGSGFINSVQFSTVPEPSTVALLSLGLLGLSVRRKR